MQTTIRVLTACLTLLSLAACQSDPPAPAVPALKANASVTVFPVRLGEQASVDVANIVGIFLEKGGLPPVAVADAVFAPPAGQDLAAEAAAFGAFVGKRGLATDYALHVAVRGTPGRSIDGMRAVLADAQGKVVWSEQQQKGSKEFDAARPGEPLECLVLLAQRLRAPLQLVDPMGAEARPSRLEQRMRQQTGAPEPAEEAAMQRRLRELRAGSKPRIRVLPARVGDQWSEDFAAGLAAAIEKAGLATATAAKEPVRFTAKPASNEQVTLWSAARSIQQAVRQAGPTDAWLLFTDCLMAGKDRVGAVHTFLVAPDGELVFVDYQNSHHDDFRQVAPTDVQGCGELALRRLRARLRD